MKDVFTISFNTLIGILISAETYYKRHKDNLDSEEQWESLVLENLERFITLSNSTEFKIIGK